MSRTGLEKDEEGEDRVHAQLQQFNTLKKRKQWTDMMTRDDSIRSASKGGQMALKQYDVFRHHKIERGEGCSRC